MFCAVNLITDFLIIPALLQLLLSAASLASGILYFRYVSRRLKSRSESFEGLVTVFVPCRGAEPGLRENLRALLAQNRNNYEVIFIVDDEDDPAADVILEVSRPFENARMVVAGPAKDCGQKVHNLIKGIEAADNRSAAFVFVDSDARPSIDWLTDILSPLCDPEVGCSTGYRWFVQEKGGIATHLRSAWNATIASALGPDHNSNFCWGGSSAIRRSVFEKMAVVNRWKGTVSDDFVLTKAINESRFRIHFEPKCLTASIGDCGFLELLEFSTRQMRITRVYSARHFAVSTIGAALFTFTFFPLLVALPQLNGFRLYAFGTVFLLIWLFGSAKALLRLIAAKRCLPEYGRSLDRQFAAHLLLWPVSTVLFLINDLLALCTRKITWRGITYELVSDKETRIID